jgi:O-antigen ligase
MAPLREFALEKMQLKDLSGEIRKQQWKETWTMMKEENMWVMGAGLANYQSAIKPYHQEGIFFNHDNNPRYRNEIVWGGPEQKQKYWQPVEIYMYPHNFFLNFWTELGLLGMIMAICLVVKFIFITIQLIKKSKTPGERAYLLGLLGALLALVVHGVVDVPYFKNDLAVLWWVVFALLSLVILEGEAHPEGGELRSKRGRPGVSRA